MTELPPPPNGDRHWSIVTLAEYLCVTPAAVDGRLGVAPSGDSDDSPDLLRARLNVTFRDAEGAEWGDCYLTRDAAERIATEFPVGPLARAVLADEPEMAALLGWDQIYALARHVVEVGGPPASSP